VSGAAAASLVDGAAVVSGATVVSGTAGTVVSGTAGTVVIGTVVDVDVVVEVVLVVVLTISRVSEAELRGTPAIATPAPAANTQAPRNGAIERLIDTAT